MIIFKLQLAKIQLVAMTFHFFQNQHERRNRSGNSAAVRATSAEISPTSSVTSGTTRAIIERTRSSRVVGVLVPDDKAATLPRKGVGLFVKANQVPRKTLQPSFKNKSAVVVVHQDEAFVDDVDDLEDLEPVEPDEHTMTQTLPRSYKTGPWSSRSVNGGS
jgi:hypothetical protein